MAKNDDSVWLDKGTSIHKGIAGIGLMVVFTSVLCLVIPGLFGAEPFSKAFQLVRYVLLYSVIVTVVFGAFYLLKLGFPNLRSFFRNFMILGIAAIVLLAIYQIIFGLNIERSSENFVQFKEMWTSPVFMTTLIVCTITALALGIYLSDFHGSIEPEADGIFDVISLIISRIAMVMVGIIVLVMFYEVIARYVFASGTKWANELSLWIAGIVFLFAGLYAMQQRSHIRIYIIYDMMPRWMQKSADVLSLILIWIFVATLIWGGYTDMIKKLERMETYGTAWDPPIPSTTYAAIMIVIFMVALQALSNLIADWNKSPEHHSPMDEIDEVEIENIRKTLEDKA